MTHTYSIKGMTCSHCVATVQKVLSSVKGVTEVNVSLDKASASIGMSEPVPFEALQGALKNHTYQLVENGAPAATKKQTFWSDTGTWGRASLNTLNCLIGCSIGDFGMVLYLQAFYPATSMVLQMVLATVAGLATSVMLETVLLRSREKFGWSMAFQTALSMSFISMVAMETVMNATDFMITGGKAAFENPLYWSALLIAMVAGFIAPLPYNYFKLKKYNQACH